MVAGREDGTNGFLVQSFLVVNSALFDDSYLKFSFEAVVKKMSSCMLSHYSIFMTLC